MENPSKTIDRRHDLDALRAIAMLLGILIHAVLSFSLMPWVVQDNHRSELFGLIHPFLHGFRMPLFFLISGFFTAMLWRKRGLGSLVWHRFRRIFLPLVVFMITIIPVQIAVIVWATIGQENSSDTSLTQVEDNIWSAARYGDLDAISQYIEEGADLNQSEAQGLKPLNMAALFGQPEVVEMLLDNGADINAQSQDGSTALHNTAFVGDDEIAGILIQRGADTQIRNIYNQVAFEVLDVDWGTTQFILDLIQREYDQQAVEEGRENIRKLLGNEPGETTEIVASTDSNNMSDFIRIMQVTPVFHHLWFLWFLCWLVAGFIVYALLANLVGLKSLPSWLIVSPVRYLWLVPLTLIAQWYMFEPSFGPDTSIGLIPYFHVLAYYAIFFYFGALYFDMDDPSGKVGSRFWITLPVAIFVVFPIGVEFLYGGFGFRESVDSAYHTPISNVMQVLFGWMMTFGLMGLFRRYCSGESAWMRYISDSSYWLYVAHLPLIIALQIIVRGWDVPAIVKLILICVISTGILLLSYEWLVRYTWIGTFLNGPRYRKSAESKA